MVLYQLSIIITVHYCQFYCQLLMIIYQGHQVLYSPVDSTYPLLLQFACMHCGVRAGGWTSFILNQFGWVESV